MLKIKKMKDKELKITPQLIKDHNLTEEEYQKILGILGREPIFTELGIFSAMWSEHCSYKSTKNGLKPCIPKHLGLFAGLVKMRA